MKKYIPLLLIIIFACSQSWADKIYQDFEPDNGSGQYGWAFNGAVASLSGLTEPSHAGDRTHVYEPFDAVARSSVALRRVPRRYADPERPRPRRAAEVG